MLRNQKLVFLIKKMLIRTCRVQRQSHSRGGGWGAVARTELPQHPNFHFEEVKPRGSC